VHLNNYFLIFCDILVQVAAIQLVYGK